MGSLLRELAGYTAGGRALADQRIDGDRCLIDMPAGDRVRLVERGPSGETELRRSPPTTAVGETSAVCV